MSRFLAWANGVLGVWLAALYFGPFALLAGLVLLALAWWFRRQPPVFLIVIAACVVVVLHSPVPSQATPTGQPLSLDAVTGADLAARVGYNAGWRGPVLVEAVAYAGIESTWRQGAVSPTGCIGEWQLCPSRTQDFDPQQNADDAYAKWAGCDGGSFGCAWDPYDGGHDNPAWGADYAVAQQAVAGLPRGGA